MKLRTALETILSTIGGDTWKSMSTSDLQILVRDSLGVMDNLLRGSDKVQASRIRGEVMRKSSPAEIVIYLGEMLVDV